MKKLKPKPKPRKPQRATFISGIPGKTPRPRKTPKSEADLLRRPAQPLAVELEFENTITPPVAALVHVDGQKDPVPVPPEAISWEAASKKLLIKIGKWFS
jgi:hypothetical protein